MFQGMFKSAIKMPDTNTNYIFGTGSIPINIKTAQLATFADGTTKQQGYQVAEVNKLISTMLTGWDANGNKPKSMSDNYLELILSCDNGFLVKKRLQFPHIIAWQDDSTPYNIADVYKEFSVDNWLKADDFENPDITLVVEPTDEILTTSTATPPEATTEQSGRFYLYYRNLPVGVNRVHIDFHIKTKTEPIDFDLEVIDGLSWKDAQIIIASNEQAKINVLLSGVKDVYKFTGAEGNFEEITLYEWCALYQQIISLNPTNKFTHDLFFVLYKDTTEESNFVEIVNDLSTGGADKALSAEMGKEIWDSVSEVIELSRDITSKFSMIQDKQSFGNVGQSINFGDLSGAEYTVIDIEGVYVNFKSMPQPLRPSSYLQYTNSDGIIIARKFENIGNNIKCEEFIKFPEGATKCYVTGAKGTLSIIRKGIGDGKLTKEVNKLLAAGESDKLFQCKDYGVMPSCLQGDSGAFLQDGVDSGGNAIIKYADVIAKYDELVTAYPSYIKKKELGFDASGTIPMYAYTLEPKYPTQSIYLQAGVHGWEPDPIFALAMITTLIANAYGTTSGDGLKVDDNALKFIRENVKATIVPCVNPYGFNNRADCGIDKRAQAQNNSKGINLNAAWNSNNSNAAEAIAVRTLIESIKDELSFAIDMHSTVWEDSLSRYGCFHAGVNDGSNSLLTVFKTYEWLYKFYDMKYPSIVQGKYVPNPLGDGYASIGTMTGGFSSWIYSTYGIESTTMEFCDHVWTSELHTSVAMSVAVNMYLNQFIQHICAKFKTITPNVDSIDIYPARG